MRFLIKFSYDGTKYNGFQTQKNLPSIQECIENALSKINNGKNTPIVASGRTDKGVHALAQYGHADLNVKITEKNLKRALNSNLPNDIHVISTKEVDKTFHARYDVKTKEYLYIINIGEYNPMERNYVFQYNYDLDLNKMAEALKVFVGKHDFRAFVTNNKEKENCVRTITNASIEKKESKIYIKFKGDGFLRYQVRNMIGILIRIGENKLTIDELNNILLSKDRTKNGKTAPPEGLYLISVNYK